MPSWLHSLMLNGPEPSCVSMLQGPSVRSAELDVTATGPSGRPSMTTLPEISVLAQPPPSSSSSPPPPPPPCGTRSTETSTSSIGLPAAASGLKACSRATSELSMKWLASVSTTATTSKGPT